MSWDLVDIEDLAAAGKSEVTCPYYLQKQRLGEADIILASYNHLINQHIGDNGNGGFKIDLADSILIVDEGHNISETSDEIMSFQIENTLLEGCLEELDALKNYMAT